MSCRAIAIFIVASMCQITLANQCEINDVQNFGARWKASFTVSSDTVGISDWRADLALGSVIRTGELQAVVTSMGTRLLPTSEQQQIEAGESRTVTLQGRGEFRYPRELTCRFNLDSAPYFAIDYQRFRRHR